jgi:hypothetical protein
LFSWRSSWHERSSLRLPEWHGDLDPLFARSFVAGCHAGRSPPPPTLRARNARPCRNAGLDEAGDAAIGGIPQQKPDDRAFPASSRIACRDAFGVEPTAMPTSPRPSMTKRSKSANFWTVGFSKFHRSLLWMLTPARGCSPQLCGKNGSLCHDMNFSGCSAPNGRPGSGSLKARTVPRIPQIQ